MRERIQWGIMERRAEVELNEARWEQYVREALALCVIRGRAIVWPSMVITEKPADPRWGYGMTEVRVDGYTVPLEGP